MMRQLHTLPDGNGSLDSYIDGILAASGTPSISYAIIQNGCTMAAGHRGYRHIAKQLSPDEDTRYCINSLTKAFVAVLLATLVDEGLIQWDTRIKQVLPEFKCQDPLIEDKATVMDLLSHRTGLGDTDSLWLGTQNNLLIPPEDALTAFASCGTIGPFRDSFAYNNLAYELLRMVIEKITGRSLSDLLSERLFTPLGMTRTSTSWMEDDANEMKSYHVLQDLSAVEIKVPNIGRGTIMEAAGGIKSTLKDLCVFYTELVRASSTQFAITNSHTSNPIFKNCSILMSNHARLPGHALREQGYGAGFTRAQLPGQLGRISYNSAIGDEPTVGDSYPSFLDIYHHGSMPGCTSCVHLLLELDLAVVVLQNSMAPIDTADFVGQFLLEQAIGFHKRNDYLELSSRFTARSLTSMDHINASLEQDRENSNAPMSKPLSGFCGRYWHTSHIFHITVSIIDESKNGDKESLQFAIQGLSSEVYKLKHHYADKFSWSNSYDKIAKMGRGALGYPWQYYVFDFHTDRSDQGDSRKNADVLRWAWNPDLPEVRECFWKEGRVDELSSQTQKPGWGRFLSWLLQM